MTERLNNDGPQSLRSDEGFDADATVVRAVAPAEQDADATVVRPKLGIADADADATVVRPRPPVEEDADATVVRPRPVAADTDAATSGSHSAPARVGPDHRGDPVPDPEHPAAAAAAQAAAEQRAAAREAAATHDRAGFLRRAANFMPRVYAPRSIATTQAAAPIATEIGGVAETHPRAQLPSLGKRDRRARYITLAAYAASVCVAGVGLWFVATLAFAG